MKFLIGLAAPIACGATAFADVRIVSINAPGAFPTIQSAIDASVDGDVVVIEPGVYSAFSITAKSLHVGRRSASGTVIVNGASQVVGLPLGGVVSLSHLSFSSSDASPALSISNCADAVRLQQCVFATSIAMGAHGVVVTNSSNVVLSAVTSSGANGKGGAQQLPWGVVGTSQTGGAALLFEASSAALYQTSATGGTAGTAQSWVYGRTGRGGPGCWLRGGSVFAAGSSFLGGDGGDSQLPSQVCNQSSWFGDTLGRGGPGVTGEAPAPFQWRVVAGSLQPGQGGTSNCSWNSPEVPPASAFHRGPAGSTRERVGDGLDRRMDLQSLIVAGSGALPATFSGRPGEHVRVLVSPAADFVWSPSLSGVLALSLPSALPMQSVGTVGSLGTLSASIDAPVLPAGVANESWHVQPLFVDAFGTSRLGTPYCVTRVE